MALAHSAGQKSSRNFPRVVPSDFNIGSSEITSPAILRSSTKLALISTSPGGLPALAAACALSLVSS